MGLLSSLAGIAAPIAGNLIAPGVGGVIGGALGGLISSQGSPKSATSTQQTQLDPRVSNIVFGTGAGDGLLNRYQGLLDTPESDAAKSYAGTAGDYLNKYAGQDLNNVRNTALDLSMPNGAPLTGAAMASVPSYAVGNQVQAPGQNDLNLSPTFQSLLSGGDTSKLMDSLQAGNALTNAQFAQNTSNATDALMRHVLPSIRSDAVLSGQYGGSRQGIAEGNAIGDYSKALASGATQLGLANSANNASQIANDYQQGQNRALAAAQGLSGQQYGTAFQNANTANQAEFMNVGNQLDVSKFNAGQQQGANMANLGSQLQTVGQNNSAAATGAGLLGGLLGQTSGALSAPTGYLQGVNGLLAPYLNANQTSTNTQPLYQNTGGNILGGALLGNILTNGFSNNKQDTPSMGAGNGTNGGAPGTWFNGYQWVPIGS